MTLCPKLVAAGLVVALAFALAADYPQMQTRELAGRLQAKGARPALFHVGFAVLYRSKHIPDSVYAGPAATPEGLAVLKDAVAKLPRDAEIVVYCGCCPWDHCPNIKPAMELLNVMGFTRARALYVPTNMAKDWFDLGYPATR